MIVFEDLPRYATFLFHGLIYMKTWYSNEGQRCEKCLDMVHNSFAYINGIKTWKHFCPQAEVEKI